MLLHRGERYRLYPTPAQVERLRAWEGALRWLWNHWHTERVAKLEEGCKLPTAFAQSNDLSALRGGLKTCAERGHVAAENRRTQSKFECAACGHRANADTNAAKGILRRGMRGAEGCGGDAIGRPVKQQLRVARRGSRNKDGALVVPTKAPELIPG